MNKKIIFGIIGLLILGMSLAAGIILVKKNQDIREKAAPATVLSVIPLNQSKNPGNTFVVNVVADSGENTITGVDIVLNYNSSAIQVTNIVGGNDISGFSTVINNKIDNTSGKITYSAFTLDSSAFAKGSGITLLTVTGKVLTDAMQGTYNFSFDNQTAIAGSSEGQNILVSSSQGGITVLTTLSTDQATATATSTSISTATSVSSGLSATATATATSTATSSSNKTATPTVTATIASGNKTATLTPTSTAKSIATPTAKSMTSTPTGVGATAFPLPVSGSSFPSIILGVFAIVLIVGSSLLAL